MWVNILYCFTEFFTNCSSNIVPFYHSLSCLCWSPTVGILWAYVVQSISRVWLFGLQQPKLHCPSLSPRVCSNSCPLSKWCYPIISSSVTPFSSCCQSFPAWGSFPMNWHFISSIYIVTHVFYALFCFTQTFPFHTVYGVLKARILKWFAIPLSSGSCFVRTLHHDPSILGGPTRHGS